MHHASFIAINNYSVGLERPCPAFVVVCVCVRVCVCVCVHNNNNNHNNTNNTNKTNKKKMAMMIQKGQPMRKKNGGAGWAAGWSWRTRT